MINLMIVHNNTRINPQFDDNMSYVNDDMTDAGRNVPEIGLKIRVISESEDRTAAKILIYCD
ncbi:immune inhibitor A domain-containing protein [Chengkuizengella axinellae]|uniref:Immune inhibitor A n=1 Tax=Chengkuizengella axinellae TaxID=3064388 RepID=A0ABT9IY41_9BACL|nr:immune inhibitor A domain-containing protein [Chengkuizengella sp. 2205SS18-9]MDP5274279.1 immune inhibitor A [Chengkuizengella sp. 2205SS18-9]